MSSQSNAANDETEDKKSLAGRLLLLNDDLYQLLSICTFYQESLRRLATENELRDKSKINLGMGLVGNWVNEQGDTLLRSLEDIENRVKDIKSRE